jgi:branched-subunit amino acid transport protein
VSAAWVAVAAIGVTSMLLKGFGPAVLGGRPLPPRLGGRPLPPRLAGVVALLAPTLLAALIVVAVLDDGGRIAVDARLAGLGAAAVALWLRAPALVVVLVAAGTTALLRLVIS